jgi:hypothetical protein
VDSVGGKFFFASECPEVSGRFGAVEWNSDKVALASAATHDYFLRRRSGMNDIAMRVEFIAPRSHQDDFTDEIEL